MSRYKDIDLYTKILREEIRDIKNFENSMYRKGKRNGLILAKAILLDGERIPTADVTEVVRCEDCKYYTMNTELLGNVCNRLFTIFPMKSDDFCSYGERKDGE